MAYFKFESHADTLQKLFSYIDLCVHLVFMHRMVVGPRTIMTFNKSLSLLGLLIITLFLCDNVMSGVDLFDAAIKGQEKQQDYLTQWNELISVGEITVGEIEIGLRTFPIYKFEGDKVKKMKVKEIFYMLQNWLLLQTDAKHRVIEMNIGGKSYRFRIYLDFRSKGHIVIGNEKGQTPKRYTDYYSDLCKGDIKKIAKAMLQSSRQPMNAQTPWVVGDEEVADEQTREIMREAMVVTQVAEAARPREDSFIEFKKIMDEVTTLQIDSESQEWNKQMTELLSGRQESLQLNEEQYNELTNQLLAKNKQLRKVARELVRPKSTLTPNDFLAQLDLPVDLPQEFTNGLIQTAKTVISDVEERAKQSWLEKVEKYSPRNGRIPGSDKVVRQIFQQISEGKFDSFEKAFKELFPLSKVTQTGREKLFDLGNKFEELSSSDSEVDLGNEPSSSDSEVDLGNEPSSSDSEVDLGNEPLNSDSEVDLGNEQIGKKRKTKKKKRKSRERKVPSKRRPEMKVAASGDGDKSVVEEKIKTTLADNSCKRRRKRDGSCTLKQLKVVDDSFRWEGETLYYQTVDEDGIKITHEVEVYLKNMATPELTEERLSNLRESGLLEGTEATGKALGVYGAAVGILASIQYFSQDEYGRAAFSAIQATHAIGGLTGVNDVVAKVTKQAVRKTVTLTAEKIGLEKTLERMSELGAKSLGESTSKVLGRLAGDIPFVGLAFDAYFISEDIKDLKDENSSTPEALKIAHLVLDVDTTVLTLIETAQPELIPFLEPFIIGLTIVRISIDNFYLEIQDELAKVKGKSFGEQVGAFLKGFAEGAADFFTLGLVQQIKGLKTQQERDRELLTNLSNPASYFNVTFQGLDENGEQVGTVDFTAGILSEFGGFLTLKLNENGTFTVELPEVPTASGIPTQVVKTFSFGHPVNDVVLGIGEVANPRYIHEEAKLWLFIPVEGFDIIDGFDTHQSSQYGVYTGNSNDNNFYAVQGGKKRKRSLAFKKRRRRRSQTKEDCTSSNEVSVHLNSYHYDLYGRGGDDRFFLGPQTTHVAGGDDNDLYYIHANGGRAIINNFAHDQEMDTLFLNVSHQRIRCMRNEWDLLVSYCQDTSHSIKIKNWFSHGNEEFHRHIYFATQDGVVIEVTDSGLNNGQHQVSCNAVSIDKSSSTSAETLILTGSLSEVKQVTGSNYSDVITANERPNILNGGLGDDQITGANGSDIYLVNRGGGSDIISNYATDKQEDTIIFGIPYVEVIVERSQSDLVLYASSDNFATQVTLHSWFEGQDWQHAVFVSSDYIRFVVKEDESGIPRKHPLSIDLSEYQHGVRLNLQNPSDNQIIHVDTELADEVKVIIDSPHDDTLIGNAIGNFLSCTNGTDFLQGNGGKDTYVINEKCSSVTIQNMDENGDFDMMLLNCSSPKVHLSVVSQSSDLILRCDLNNGHFNVCLKEWFLSPEHRHLIVKTSDKITALLPETTTEQNLNQGQLFPYQIEVEEDCDGELRLIDLTIPQYSKCERFIAKTDKCSYSIIGNELNNYLDPGSGNPFGYQNLVGNNGTDTYVMGHQYGTFNTIDNFAKDGELDHLIFKVVFHDIKVSRDANNATLTSRSRNDSARVTVINYYAGVAHQHLLVHSIDGVLFKFTEEFPYVEVIIVDFSASVFSQVLSAQENSTFSTARVLLGSKVAENHINGGSNTTKIIGGQKNDTIIGGPGGEDLIGFDGHDSIHGGAGNDALYGGDGNDFLDGGLDNDVIYGGKGADVIKGGPGSNTVVFSGYNFTGVSINLQIGLGWNADAEGDTYEKISNILSSEYDDFLIGNDDNNVIRSYGGDDFIVPAGGDDLLQGGRGTDVYQLDNAFGHKVINNFATDEELDLIVMNQTSSVAVCYYFNGEDLQLNVNFDNANSTEAVSRVSLDEDFLMITLPFWLRNSTFRHVAFSFSDGYLTPEDFDDDGKQLEPMIDLVRSGRLIHSTRISENSITLYFNESSWNDVSDSHETLSLQYVHFDYNSTTYYPLVLPPPKSITINDLAAGSTQSFTLILSSCELTLAISPLLYDTIPPNQPTGLVADPLFDGFALCWNPPDSLTDPLVDDYEYIVRIWSDEQARESFEQITNSSTISIFCLNSKTEYNISVSSLVYNTTSIPVQITATTAGNACTNLIDLPSHMFVEDLTQNEQGQIVAIVSCETGYELEGDSNIICNDSISTPSHCTITTCTLPEVTNAELFEGSDIPTHGDTFTWRCSYGYEISPDGTNNFMSVCSQGSWSPEIQTCRETEPKCTSLRAPQYGSVSATAAYVGETVIYSCSSGYNLQGPVVKHCTRFENEANWVPSDETLCVTQVCPALLPQTQGSYSVSKPQYVTGDMVELVCNAGYYARDVRNNPERVQLVCNGHDWNLPQRHCQSIVQVVDARHYITHVDMRAQYSISSLQGLVVHDSLYPQVCQQILPNFVRLTSDAQHQRLQCYRDIYLASGPNPFDGILKISSENGFAYVCVESTHFNTASEVCSQLGYGQYTASIYHSAMAITTTYESTSSSSLQIVSNVKQCNYRISCRKTCDQLFLPNGNWQNGCPYRLEGERCDFFCNPLYGIIGSSSRNCTSNGWTGSHPNCDGE